MSEQNTFKLGQTYRATSVCDSNCHWYFTITRRTERTVWWTGENVADGRAKVHTIPVWRLDSDGDAVIDNDEYFFPFGRYSMAPACNAEYNVVEEFFTEDEEDEWAGCQFQSTGGFPEV